MISSTPTTTQHAVDALRRAIVAGELSPGGRIRQEQFAERLGTSIGPVREALRILEQEGQVTYQPRRGYLVTELRMADLLEIYELRRLIETQAVREALPALDEEATDRIEAAARECVDAVESGDIARELAANRRFHMALLDSPDHPHTMRVLGMLWDSTEAYRGLYYAVADERHEAISAHDVILDALRLRDADALVAALDAHRQRALDVLEGVLGATAVDAVIPVPAA